MRRRRSLGGGFSPRKLFADGTVGAWYDPSDYSTLFQDSAGITPVTAVEQSVRLMLDKSRGLVLGSELVTNGTFDSNINGWTAQFTSTASWQAGALRSISSGTNAGEASTPITCVVGRTYRVTGSILGGTSTGRITASSSAFGGTGGSYASSGTQTFYFVATATTMYVVCGNGGATNGVYCDYDNISVKELSGNHALAPNDASRPILRARYNLLTYSEQFNNAAWVKTAGISAFGSGSVVNAATAPDGTQTADLIVESAAGAGSVQHSLYQTFSVSAATYTLTIFAKPSSGATRYLSIYPQGAGTAYAVFDLNSQTVSFTGGANYLSSSITAANNGFYRCAITFSAIAGTIFASAYISNSAVTAAPGYVGDGASGFYLWGADLRTGSSAGTYQRIAAAADYATAGFLPYLYFVTDDSFSTNSINFTATDKMSVCAGVTKLSDAAAGVVAELSVTSNTNAGSFALTAPAAASNTYGFALNGNALGYTVPSGYTAPITNVAAAVFDIAGASVTNEITSRINGTLNQTGSGGNAGTGNFGNYPLYIGRRGGSSLPFNGHIYGLIVAGKALSASELSATEAWMNSRTGAF